MLVNCTGLTQYRSTDKLHLSQMQPCDANNSKYDGAASPNACFAASATGDRCTTVDKTVLRTRRPMVLFFHGDSIGPSISCRRTVGAGATGRARRPIGGLGGTHWRPSDRKETRATWQTGVGQAGRLIDQLGRLVGQSAGVTA
jgi:hypothetical protein